MEISLIVAKVLGVYAVVSGFFLIFRGKTLPHMLKDFYDHSAIVFLTGVILIFLSTLFLLENNIWDGTWRTFITVIVWATLLKGLAYLFAPELLVKMVNKKLLNSVSAYGLVAIVFGLVLFYLG